MILPATKLVGNAVATVVVPSTKMLLALALMVKVPVALPVIWKPPSFTVQPVIAKLPLIVGAAKNVFAPAFISDKL